MFFDLEIRKKHFVNLRGLKLDLREHDFDKWAPTRENLSRGVQTMSLKPTCSVTETMS